MKIDLSGISRILARKKIRWPQPTNRLSNLDDPCLRRLYYRRTAAHEACAPDDGLQGIFETGNLLEPVVGRILAEIGEAATPPWRIVGAQTPVNDPLFRRYQISGSIDGVIQVLSTKNLWETTAICDVKTMSPHVFSSLSDYDSLAKYPWTRAYRGQLIGYALAFGLETCVIISVNKSNFYEIKTIEFPVDLEYFENLLQSAEKVNESVRAGKPPAGVNDPAICPRCPWFSYCAPPLEGAGDLEIVDNPELEAVLERLERLELAADEYAALEKERDSLLRPGQDQIVGQWRVSWKKITTTRRPSPGGKSEYWKKMVRKITH